MGPPTTQLRWPSDPLPATHAHTQTGLQCAAASFWKSPKSWKRLINLYRWRFETLPQSFSLRVWLVQFHSFCLQTGKSTIWSTPSYAFLVLKTYEHHTERKVAPAKTDSNTSAQFNSQVRSESWFQTHLFTGSTKSLGVVRNRPSASSPIVFACAVIFSYSDRARPKLWKSVGKQWKAFKPNLHNFQLHVLHVCISKDQKKNSTKVTSTLLAQNPIQESHRKPLIQRHVQNRVKRPPGN